MIIKIINHFVIGKAQPLLNQNENEICLSSGSLTRSFQINVIHYEEKKKNKNVKQKRE